MAIAKVNSEVNLNLPGSTPDVFQNPEVRQLAELLINAMTTFLSEFEKYVGATQKDITTWSSLIPSDTLIRHQAGRLYVVASEAIAFGDFINLHNTAGVLNIRKANGAAGLVKPAHGYCSTAAGIALGARGEVILSQGRQIISGVLPGQAIYMSTTPGLATTAALVGAGQLEQYLGVGVANNLAYIDISLGQYIQH